MVLHRNIDAQSIINLLSSKHLNSFNRADISKFANRQIQTPYHSQYQASINVPRFKIPKEGIAPDVAYQLITDDLDLDGKPQLNFASFVSTFADDYAQRISSENLTKNLSDADEYPALMDIHARCISIISKLWNVPKDCKAIGTATTGSSEAIHLGGLAMKQLWKEKKIAAGKDHYHPNIIMGANAQVALEKFARYFDVEARIIPVNEKSHYTLDLDKIKENLDENTIGVFVILGSTYTGHFEPVQKVSEILDEFEKETGHYVPIHVDGASGAMIAPFVYPDHVWDFRLPRVHSINTSGHKFGLCTAGLGWVIWKDESLLPQHLRFELQYLGGVEETFTLNFSRPGYPVLQQYYNLIHLGYDGFKYTHSCSLENARLLSRFLESTGYFHVLSDIHRSKGDFKYNPTKQLDSNDSLDYNYGLPVVAFTFSDEFKKSYPHVKQSHLSLALRSRGYIIPNYPLPPNSESTEVLRVVVRGSITSDLLVSLMEDIYHVLDFLVETVEPGKYLFEANKLNLYSHRAHASLGKHQSSTSDKHNKTYRGTC